MKLRVLLTMLLVVGMLPVATAQTVPSHSPDAADIAADASVAPGTDGNYTKLYVDSDDSHLELKPGERETVTITVTNGEDREVTVDPHLSVAPVRENVLKDSWISIADGETTLDAGEEREFAVTVAVPEDATLGHHNGQIAFTNETVTYPGRPARPIHAQGISVDVWRQPTVQILAGTYVHSQVKAGDSTTHQIVIENTGDEAVPLNPELNTERRSHHYGRSTTVQRSWFDVDAPAEIAPGETATVSVTVSPPASADRGRYNAELDLGLKDPARDERDSHWQRIRLNLEVWKQPSEAFETTFDVSEPTENVTLTLSSRSASYRGAQSDETDPASFDVQFVSPDGDVIDAKRVELTDTGFVDLGADTRSGVRDGEYAVRNGQQRFVYSLDDPDAGRWSLRVTPHNAIGFNYEISRNESGD